MITKTQMQTLVNTNLQDDSDITAEELREVQDIFIDEFFNETTNLTTTGVASTTCNLKFSKNGNWCWVRGTLRNATLNIIGDLTICNLPTGLEAKTGENTLANIVEVSTLQNGLVSFSGTGIYLTTNIGSGNSVRINTIYKLND